MNISLVLDYDGSFPAIQDGFRRAIDGTVPPLMVDYINKRVLIGTNTASGSNQFQVAGSGTFGGDVTASAFYGDGSQLSGISSRPSGGSTYLNMAAFGGF